MTQTAATTAFDGATVRVEIHVQAPADFAWAAAREVGAIHRRLVRGFATDTVLENGVRTVRFAAGVNPPVVKERIVAVDDGLRRLVYSAVESRALFHCASLQVLPEGDGCRLVWITDVMPRAFGGFIRANMERGIAAMQRTIEEDIAGKV